MAFVNVSLLLGGLFVAIPIVVHLALRRRPRRQTFPALRFLTERLDSNRRQLQLRHWLLLLLRCTIVGLLAAALARPSVDALQFGSWLLIGMIVPLLVFVATMLALAVIQTRGRVVVGALSVVCAVLAALAIGLLATRSTNTTGSPVGNERAPVAAALVLDTSPRMDYQFDNQTRLQVARDMATWLIGELPRGSELAIVDTRPEAARFSVDLPAARRFVERLRTSALTEPIAARVGRAIKLLQQSDRARKEVYVFTDLTLDAWPASLASDLKQTVSNAADVSVYIVDVGIEEPTNGYIRDLVLSSESAASGNELRIQAEVGNTGAAKTQIVDLILEELSEERPVVIDGETLLPSRSRRDEVTASLAKDGSQSVQFRLDGLPTGVHHGSIELRAGDGLPIDDVRHFAVEVRDARQVLVIAPANALAELFVEAIAPREFRRTGQARFSCTVVEPTEVQRQELSSYAAVCLLDPPPMETTTWKYLARYVSGGGSLAIFLGHNAHPPDEFNMQFTRELIGATLTRRWRAGASDLFMAPGRLDHPVLEPFREQSTSVPWNESPIYRHWVVEDLNDGTSTVFRYSNNKEALLETIYADGRVMTLTTPISDPLSPSGRDPWNEFPTSDNAWPYVVLINAIMDYLVNQHDEKLNFQVGDVVTLPNAAEHPSRYRLFSPDDQGLDINAHGGELTVRYTEFPGAYRLKGQLDGPVVRGFAVNVPAGKTELTRHEPQIMSTFFGENRYHFARRREEILFEVGQARIGREFYPYLLAFLVLVVGLEHVFADRFYRDSR